MTVRLLQQLQQLQPRLPRLRPPQLLLQLLLRHQSIMGVALMKSGLNVDSLTVVNQHVLTPCHTVHHPMLVSQNVSAKMVSFLMLKDCVSYQTHVLALKTWNLTNVGALANRPAMTLLPSVQVFAFQNVLAAMNISSTVKVSACIIHHVIQQHFHTGVRQQMLQQRGTVQQQLRPVRQRRVELFQTVATMPNLVIAPRTKRVPHLAITLFQTVHILVASKSALATMASF